MEFPPKVTAQERALAAALLLLLGGFLWLESRSAAASAIRRQTPWLCWLALKTPGDAETSELALAVYQPSRRTLNLVYIPDSTRLPGTKKTLGKVYAESLREDPDPARAARAMAQAAEGWLLPLVPGPRDDKPAPFFFEEASPASEDPALAAKDWVLRETQGLPFWAKLLGRMRSRRGTSTLPPFDRVYMALELHRLSPDDVLPAWLPSGDALRGLLGRLTAPEPPAAQGRTLTAEILNASGKKGVASEATKVLRLRGVDVVSFGNASAEGDARRTVVYDRTGDIANALSVRALLGCRTAEAVTKVDEKRLVDVSVVLAADCPH